MKYLRIDCFWKHFDTNLPSNRSISPAKESVFMNKNITASLAVFVAIATTMLFAQNARAEKCVTQYGGGKICVSEDAKLKVEKSVWNPEKKDWQDHIGSKEHKFDANNKIKFRIRVKNTGDVEIKDINLEDHLPSFVKYKDGDGEGKKDDTRVEFDKFDLKPGESKEFEFTAKVADDGILPKDDNICLTNVAKAEGKRADNDKKEDAIDYANFCIELPKVKGKEAPKALPKTGIDLIPGALAMGLVFVGFGLRKLTKRA